jgi:hypothetical protein
MENDLVFCVAMTKECFSCRLGVQVAVIRKPYDVSVEQSTLRWPTADKMKSASAHGKTSQAVGDVIGLTARDMRLGFNGW